MKFNSVFYLMY